MTKKLFTVFIAIALTLILVLGIAGCSDGEAANNQNQDSNISADNPTDDSDLPGEDVEASLVTISKEAADTLRGMISDGDYSEDVFLRIATVRGAG